MTAYAYGCPDCHHLLSMHHMTEESRAALSTDGGLEGARYACTMPECGCSVPHGVTGVELNYGRTQELLTLARRAGMTPRGPLSGDRR